MRYAIETARNAYGNIGDIVIVDTSPWAKDDREVCIPFSMESAKLIVDLLNTYEEYGPYSHMDETNQ